MSTIQTQLGDKQQSNRQQGGETNRVLSLMSLPLVFILVLGGVQVSDSTIPGPEAIALTTNELWELIN